MPPQESPHESSSASTPRPGGAGPTVGIIVIVLLMLVGAVYFAGTRLTESKVDTQLPLIPGTTTDQ